MPWAASSTSTADSGSASTSVSLPSTPGAATVSVVSSLVENASPVATGASFTAVTAMDTVAVAVSAPSVTV